MKIFVPFSAIEVYRNPSDKLSLFFGPFQYDYISDEEIVKHLKTTESVNLLEPWIDNSNESHAKRIAALVNLISSGFEIDPIEIELSVYNKNLNCVNDGHHRIRALEFLKKPGFWALVGGYETLILEFKQVCEN